MTKEQTFLERVAAECGLGSMFALATIRRACARAGIDPAAFGPENLEAVAPHIDKALRIFLPPDEADRAMSRILIMACDVPSGARRNTRAPASDLRKKTK